MSFCCCQLWLVVVGRVSTRRCDLIRRGEHVWSITGENGLIALRLLLGPDSGGAEPHTTMILFGFEIRGGYFPIVVERSLPKRLLALWVRGRNQGEDKAGRVDSIRSRWLLKYIWCKIVKNW